jgi:uncharacterized protein
VSKYDPAKLAEPVKLPTLLVCGQKDIQVPCATNQKLYQAFQKAGNTKATFVELPNANHVFKVVEGVSTNPLTEYSDPNLKFSPELKDSLIKFVGANL